MRAISLLTRDLAPSPWRQRLRVERFSRWGLTGAAGISLVVVGLVILFLAINAWPAVDQIGIDKIFGSAVWDPEGAYHHDSRYLPRPVFGALTPLAGSLVVVILALLVAVPVGLALAIVLAEGGHRLGDRVLRPAVELFVGVPSIVYGYLGLIIVVPALARFAPPGRSGAGFGAAAIVLGIMVVPTIATLGADALLAVQAGLREASVALGATRWQTLRRVLLPAARAGIVTGIVLGFARAMGEALAVALVIGGVPQLPDLAHGVRFLVEPGMTITTTITDGITELGSNPKAQAARYLLALVLLLFTFVAVTAVRWAQRSSTERR